MGASEPSPIFKRLGVPLPFRLIDWKDEMDMQARLGTSLVNEGGHQVYFHHARPASASGMRQFSVHGGSCRVDMLVVTRKGWSRWHKPAHDEMPCIGIEVKRSKDLEWLKQGIQQVRGYVEEALSCSYDSGGDAIPQPTHFLIVTSDSWQTGHLYRWQDTARFAPQRWVGAMSEAWQCTDDDARHVLLEHAWSSQQAVWDQVLLGLGVSVLKGSDASFSTNRFGGPIRKYTLNDRTPYLAAGNGGEW